MTHEELSDRLWTFAAQIGKFVDSLPETRVGRHVAGQLLRCGTSAPPNYDEACAGESRADFVHKVGIGLKELRETRGWLRFVTKVELLPSSKVLDLIDECEQLKSSPPNHEAIANENFKFSISNFQFAMAVFVSYGIAMFVQQTTTT